MHHTIMAAPFGAAIIFSTPTKSFQHVNKNLLFSLLIRTTFRIFARKYKTT